MSWTATKESLYQFTSKYYEFLPPIEETRFNMAVMGLGCNLYWEEDGKQCQAFIYGGSSVHLDIFSTKGKKARWFKWETIRNLGLYD